MPQNFLDYLQTYPQVFSFYNSLPLEEANELAKTWRSHLEAGRDVAVCTSPVLDLDTSPCGDNNCFIMRAPVDGFILDTMPVYWQAVPSRPHLSYNVFVPYHCFQNCAGCLDTPDLRTTLIRTLRVLRYLREPIDTVKYDRFAERWRRYRQALVHYGLYCAEEYVQRGGSDKVLEHLKHQIRRREWHKPDWVYDPCIQKQCQEHLMFRSYRRCVAKALHKVMPQGLGSYRSPLRDGSESILDYFKDHILSQSVQLLDNFYSQYNWGVEARRGDFV